MKDKMTWVPRGNIVIIKGILNDDIYKKKLTIDIERGKLEKNKDGEPLEALVLDGFDEVDIIDQDGDFYFDDYSCFVHDTGYDVGNDLEIGDEIFLNARNMGVIRGLTDRKLKETYFFAVDGVITMRRPGTKII